MSIAEKVHNAIAAVCPVRSVSIGKRDDTSTWEIEFDVTATAAQKTAARAVLRNLDAGALVARNTTIRQIERIEFPALLKQRALRDIAIAALPDGHYVRVKAEETEAAIWPLRATLGGK